MENSPNDRETARLGKAPGEEQVVDFPVRERRNEEKQKPKSSADEARDRRHEKPGHCAAGEHNDRGNSPAMIPRVAQARNAREQDQRRDDRDEEQDVIEIDQDFAAGRRKSVICRFVKLRATRLSFPDRCDGPYKCHATNA